MTETTMKIPDFPKLQCPFVRKTYKVDHKDWLKHGNRLGLREPHAYLVTPEITPGYEWVLDHPDTFAVEKLHGSNVGILTERGRLVHVQNRMNIIDPLQVMKGKTFLIEGVFNAIEKGYVKEDGLQFGELLGPKLNGNIYGLDKHLWYPFEKAQQHLRYKSFDKYPRSFLGWSAWFETGLKSLLGTKLWRETPDKIPFAEGVVFYNYTLGSSERPWMAKLRRDMYWWHYADQVKIEGMEDYWKKIEE